MTQVSGRCFDASGAPSPGVFVYAAPAGGGRFGKTPGTHSDRDGQWSLELPPGAWTVRETGHAVHELVVGSEDVQAAGVAVDQPPAEPTEADFARLLGRRQQVQPVVEDVAQPVADLTRRMNRRRQLLADQEN